MREHFIFQVKSALESRLKEQTLEIQKVLAHNENLEQHVSDMESQVFFLLYLKDYLVV